MIKILTMTVVPCVGHTGQRNLIAYICLADALDRNREVVIFFLDTGSTRVRGGGGGCAVCVSYIT